MIAPAPEFRPLCRRCLRPESACWCRDLPGIETRTKVVFLQHPRERYVAIGTARMAHLALPSSQFFRGVSFDDDARVQALADDPGAAILFPSADAVDLRDPSQPRPSTLVVVDGTWSQARKLVKTNAVLRRLPKVRFTPVMPANYRIRAEPEEHCRATIEAVVEALGILEGDVERFKPMLTAFERMIDLQIERKATRTGPARFRLPRQKQAKPPPIPPELGERSQDLVLIYGEANSHPVSIDPPIPSELIQLVAVRPATGERFEAILAPRRPFAETTPHHLELSREVIFAGESEDAARARWSAFLRPNDLLLGWGYFAWDLLRDAKLEERPLLDVRAVAAKVLKRRAGGIEQAAAALGTAQPRATWAKGRAGRRMEALERVLSQLQAQLR